MKTCGGVGVYIHVFLTLALGGGEWSSSLLGRFTPGERVPAAHWIGGWPGRATEPVWTTWRGEKSCPLPGLELRPRGCNQSLHRLRYAGSP
jgi:hypothetical protein